jgi:hypothetical protein
MAVSGKAVGTDAGIGAAAGTAFGPEGTLIGGAAGALYGVGSGLLSGAKGVQTSGGNIQGPTPTAPVPTGSSLSGSNPNGVALGGFVMPGAPGQTPDNGPRSAFTYGAQNATSQYANAAAANANALGAGYTQQGQQTGQQANQFLQGANNAQGRTAAQISVDQASKNAQLAALGGTNSAAQNVQTAAGQVSNAAGQTAGVASQLQALGSQHLGTGIAAAQLQQGQDAAARESLAMAASGRSIGGGAANMQAAQFQNAQAQQQVNGQAATANLQEQQQNQQYQLSALSGAQQGFGESGQLQGTAGQLQQGAGNLYGQAGNQATTIRQGDEGVELQNAQLQQGQEGLNNQTSQVFGGIAQGLNTTGVQQGQLGLGEQQLGNQILTTQLGANEQYQNSIEGNSIAQQGLNNQQTGMYLGAAGAAAQAYGNYEGSDVSAKKDIAPADGESPWKSWGALARAVFGGGGDKNARPPAMVRDPNNPSQMVSPFAYIGAAADAAGPQRWGSPSLLAPHSPAPTQLAVMPGQSDAPSTWGGAQTPVQPGYDTGALDAAYAQQGQPPPAYAVSDVHSKARIHSLSAENAELQRQLAALSGPTPQMLEQAARDQDRGSKIAYPAARPGPTAAMLQQAAQQPQVSIGEAQNVSYPPQVDIGEAQDIKYPGQVQASDVHSKSRIAELEGQLAALGGAQTAMSARRTGYPSPVPPGTFDDAYRTEGGVPNPAQPGIDLRPAKGYSYEYKEPERFGQGRFYGPMAQDLEKTPAGASVVKKAPDGTKMVDTSRLSLVNTAAISDLQKQLAALGGGRPQYPTPQAPNYGNIDLYRGMQRGGTL